MNPIPLFADLSSALSGGWILIAIVGLAIMLVVGIAVVLSRYTKVGPNEVLIVSGKKHRYADPDGSIKTRGFRIVKGGGTFVYPVVEKVDILSLELLTIDVQTPEVYTSKGVPVKVDGVAQIKVKGDDISIATAAEQFLGKNTDEIRNIATQHGRIGWELRARVDRAGPDRGPADRAAAELHCPGPGEVAEWLKALAC